MRRKKETRRHISTPDHFRLSYLHSSSKKIFDQKKILSCFFLSFSCKLNILAKKMVSRRLEKFTSGKPLLEGNQMCSINKTIV